MITRSGRSHLIPPYGLEAIWREGEGRDQLFLLVLLILPRPRALDKVFGGDEILKIHSVVQTHLRYEIEFSPFHTVGSTTSSRLEWVEKQLRGWSPLEVRARSRSRNQSARPCSRYFTSDWIILFLSPSTSPYACSDSGHQTRNSNCYTSPKSIFISYTYTCFAQGMLQQFRLSLKTEGSAKGQYHILTYHEALQPRTSSQNWNCRLMLRTSARNNPTHFQYCLFSSGISFAQDTPQEFNTKIDYFQGRKWSERAISYSQIQQGIATQEFPLSWSRMSLSLTNARKILDSKFPAVKKFSPHRNSRSCTSPSFLFYHLYYLLDFFRIRFKNSSIISLLEKFRQFLQYKSAGF